MARWMTAVISTIYSAGSRRWHGRSRIRGSGWKIGHERVGASGNTGALPGAQRQAMLNELRKEQKLVAELEGTVARLAATVKEQAAQIQKVSAQLEMSKPAAQVVSYGQ